MNTYLSRSLSQQGQFYAIAPASTGVLHNPRKIPQNWALLGAPDCLGNFWRLFPDKLAMHIPAKGLLDTRAGCACATAMLIGTALLPVHFPRPVGSCVHTVPIQLLSQRWYCRASSCKCCLLLFIWKVATGTLPVQAGNRWGANDAVEYTTHSGIVAWSEEANKPWWACKIFP